MLAAGRTRAIGVLILHWEDHIGEEVRAPLTRAAWRNAGRALQWAILAPVAGCIQVLIRNRTYCLKLSLCEPVIRKCHIHRSLLLVHLI